PPSFSISANVGETSVSVTIQNIGGPLPASNVAIEVRLGGSSNRSASQNISLQNGQSANFTVSRPVGSGTAEIVVYVDDQQFASTTIEIGGGEPPTATP